MSKYYITVNPHGGTKKGVAILEKVLPVFDSANAEVKVVETEYAGHARELAREVEIDGYDGFCCIGGDGTMHEAINGIMTRKDGKKIPIGLITGGTGNSFMHDMDCLDPVNAAKRIVTGRRRLIDIFKCEADGTVYYGFNIIGWGIPTDMNILAEKMRWMGKQRYNVAAIIEVIRHRMRFARIEIDGNMIGADFGFVIGCNTIHTGAGMKMAPLARLDDGLIDLLIVRKVGRLKLLKLFPKIFSGRHIGDPALDYRQVSDFCIKPEDQNTLNIDGEMLGCTPVRVTMMSKEIEVLV
ncbi:MAG: diacylglycerol kinase family lipid kinase [Candidatus Marinimicrobia bacterium]|jgi:YegS/Rv2252/BmrU family lipid kinase|nr:diacylglycerol kinase family lipid kinase [Candidatus Neomarinimicrobiota bacterium]|tara:strand:- start:752 stop:1639 length:888 start_codon:yes stop_codon:yes gene_type:complete